MADFYFSTCLIGAGARNAYLPVVLPGRLPHSGRGRAVLVAERDHVPVRHGRGGTTLREPVPRPRGWRGGRSCPVPGRGGGVRIAVGALADHAGSRVIRVRGPPPDMNSAPAMSPAIPPVSMSGAAPRSQ